MDSSDNNLITPGKMKKNIRVNSETNKLNKHKAIIRQIKGRIIRDRMYEEGQTQTLPDEKIGVLRLNGD